jgi:hypothetical protein
MGHNALWIESDSSPVEVAADVAVVDVVAAFAAFAASAA